MKKIKTYFYIVFLISLFIFISGQILSANNGYFVGNDGSSISFSTQDNNNDDNDNNNNDDNDLFGDPFTENDNENNNTNDSNEDNSNNNENNDSEDDDPFGDPFSNNDNNNENDNSNNEDDPFGDPFGNNDNDNDDSNENNNEDENNNDGNGNNFIDFNDIDIPKPEYSIHGTIGLGLTTLFLGDNVYTDEMPEDEPLNRYLASDVYANINASYEFNGFYLYGSLDTLATIDTSGIPQFEIDVREMYVNYHSNIVELSLGHLLIGWSPMELFTLTNYFNPMSTDFYSKELMEGVNGFRSQFFININNGKINYISFDVVLLPLFTESAFSSSRLNPISGLDDEFGQTGLDDITDIDGEEDDVTNQTPQEDDTQAPALVGGLTYDTTPPSPDILNTQFGFRYGMVFPGVDVYLMYFHGFFNGLLFTLKNEEVETDADIGDPSDDVLTSADDYGSLFMGARSLDFNRVYRIIDSIGINSTFKIWEMTWKADAKFTFNEPIVYKKKVFIESTGVFTDYALTRSPTIQFSLGLDWEFVSDWRLILEYNEHFVLEQGLDLETDLLPGNTIAGGIIYILSKTNFELTFTQGLYYDYMDRQIASASYIKADLLNGFYGEVALIYLNDFREIIDGEERLGGTFGPLNRSFVLTILLFYEF